MMKFNETPEQEVMINTMLMAGCREWPYEYDALPGTGASRAQFESRDGWIVWRGGECPVDDDEMIEVQWADGESSRYFARELAWGCSGFCAVAYRPHKPASPKPQGHPHAELMAQYAEDAKTNAEPWLLWEVKLGSWDGLIGNPIWNSGYEYRRKPKTKLIHGVEVPDISFVPKEGDDYYTPDLRFEKLYSENHFCHNCKFTSYHSGHGMCYPKTEEGKQAAILHAKAMLGIA